VYITGHSSVSKVTDYGPDDQGSISGMGKELSLHNHVQTGSGTHPASYPMGTGYSFPGSKAAGA